MHIIHERFRRVVWLSRADLASAFASQLVDAMLYYGGVTALVEVNITPSIVQFCTDMDVLYGFTGISGAVPVNLDTLYNQINPSIKSNLDLQKLLSQYRIDYDAFTQNIVIVFATNADAYAWLNRHHQVSFIPPKLR